MGDESGELAFPTRRALAHEPLRLADPNQSILSSGCCRFAEQEHLSADREKDRAVLLESREEEDEEVLPVWPFSRPDSPSHDSRGTSGRARA